MNAQWWSAKKEGDPDALILVVAGRVAVVRRQYALNRNTIVLSGEFIGNRWDATRTTLEARGYTCTMVST